MRKIEKAMIAAVKARKEWKSGNTWVTVKGDGMVQVYLHDNLIANIPEHTMPIAHNSNWQTWPTRTTASRLRALGFTYDNKAERWE